MSEKNFEILTGTVVLIIAVLFLIFTFRVTGLDNTRDGYNLDASFRSAEGINIGTEVRMAGVKIGSVSDLSLNGNTLRADANLQISKDIFIPNDSSAVISSESLLGGSFVEIIPGGSLDNFSADELIEDTQGSISLINLLLKMFGGSKE
jgi:phospholipid/cholesterol/gamma-HCH transport system substrate-binding protein